MKLAVTIDVEEEGLFTGRYASGSAPCENVTRLALLDSLFSKYEIRPTLLVTYQAARDPSRLAQLIDLADKWRGEIGAHLHPWNTPPLQQAGPRLLSSEETPRELLSAKLETLVTTLQGAGIDPASFRMGRFNLGPRMLSILNDTGFKVDSSICPMRKYHAGPDHLAAPTDPYHPDPSCPTKPGKSSILEVPLTVLPVIPGMGYWADQAVKAYPSVAKPVVWLAKNIGSLSAQPFWLGLRRLKTAARLHRRRGGRVITVFFHSSELLPDGCPQHRTEEDTHLFLNKLSLFFSWLRQEQGFESVTLAELPGLGFQAGEGPPSART
ncbi:MAG: hypothetical protein HQK55_19370 [Deltaproteobacteria bacterium]|nr:hypothetical protein [Deltaproteobacteria bacterium]